MAAHSDKQTADGSSRPLFITKLLCFPAGDGEQIVALIRQRNGQRTDRNPANLGQQLVSVADRERRKFADAGTGILDVRLAPHPDFAEAARVAADKRIVLGCEKPFRHGKEAAFPNAGKAVPPLAVDAERLPASAATI